MMFPREDKRKEKARRKIAARRVVYPRYARRGAPHWFYAKPGALELVIWIGAFVFVFALVFKALQ
jgi:hypothetical protein